MNTETEIETIENEENETLDIDVSESGEVEIEVPIIDVEPETATSVENTESINVLINTIAVLNDSINGLRLQVESERNTHTETIHALITAGFDSIKSDLEQLKVIEAAENHNEERETIADEVKDVANKPVRRWL